MHPFNNGANMGEGEDVFDHNSVNLLIIEYGAITPILLFNVEDGGQI
jgi:hypothetical protein